MKHAANPSPRAASARVWASTSPWVRGVGFISVLLATQGCGLEADGEGFEQRPAIQGDLADALSWPGDPGAPPESGDGGGAGAGQATQGPCPLTGGRFLLTEPDDVAVGVFDAQGVRLATHVLDHEYARRPTRVARDADCNVIVADWQTYSVFLIGADGATNLAFRSSDFEEPIDMIPYQDGTLILWNDTWNLTVHGQEVRGWFTPEGAWPWAAARGEDDTLWVASETEGGRLIVQYTDATMGTKLDEMLIPNVQSMRWDPWRERLVLGLEDEIRFVDPTGEAPDASIPANGRVFQLEMDHEGTWWRLDESGLWAGDRFVMPVASPTKARFHLEDAADAPAPRGEDWLGG